MQQELPAGQDNVIVRNQEVYGFLPKDVINRLGDTSTQLATEDQTALGAINELKSNLTEKTKDIATATISSTATTKYTTAGDGWRICMRNGIVSLDMVIDVKAVQSGWTDVGQIPSNFPYPPQTIYFPCNTWSTASGTKLDLQITTGGVIKMRAGAVAFYYVHLSW